LAHLPRFSDAVDLEVSRRESLALTRERMLQEIAELLEALTTEIPLVLALEDLHCGDYSTLALVSVLEPTNPKQSTDDMEMTAVQSRRIEPVWPPQPRRCAAWITGR
jgi:hypothetical protein